MQMINDEYVCPPVFFLFVLFCCCCFLLLLLLLFLGGSFFFLSVGYSWEEQRLSMQILRCIAADGRDALLVAAVSDYFGRVFFELVGLRESLRLCLYD